MKTIPAEVPHSDAPVFPLMGLAIAIAVSVLFWGGVAGLIGILA